MLLVNRTMNLVRDQVIIIEDKILSVHRHRNADKLPMMAGQVGPRGQGVTML